MEKTKVSMSKDEMMKTMTAVLVSKAQDPELIGRCPYAEVPHTDLAVIAVIKTEAGSATVTNEMARALKLTDGEVTGAALKNLKETPYSIMPISAALGIPEMSGPTLYVVSTKDSVLGAAAILNPAVQKDVAERLGGDFFVLPSSKHEVLALSTTGHEASELAAMVREINRNEVSRQDQLSQEVYRYDFQARTLSLATGIQETQDRAEARTASLGRRM